MAVFPLFIDLSQKNILVIGAGNVGSRKIEKLCDFTTQLTVVSETSTNEVRDLQKKLKFHLIERSFRMSDLQDRDLIVVAVDNIQLQRQIFEHCQSQGILCNCVDSPCFCNFLFPALIKREDLVIGINTGGVAPGFSAFLRKRIEEHLPKNLCELIKTVQKMRKDNTQMQLPTYSLKVERIEKYLKEHWSTEDSKPPRDQQS